MGNIRNYLRKAKERWEISQVAYEKGFYDVCSSNLYYTLFQYMCFVLEEAEGKRWKHHHISRQFSLYSMEKGLYNKEELRRFSACYRELYDFRIEADYTYKIQKNDEIKSKLKNYLYFIKEVLNNV